MNIEKFESLNSIYKSLYDHTKSIVNELKNNNYKCEWGYFGQHYIRYNDNWLLEHFPIPVIDVNGICDIGIDLEHIFIEYKILKQTALKYNFNKLTKYNFEVYGVKNYLNDFYNAEMDLNSIKKRIIDSEENDIGISIFLDKNFKSNEIIEVIKDILSCYIETVINKNIEEIDYSNIIGKIVIGTIDRPLGSLHPKHKYIKYYINYGYVNGVMAADNSEQDIYFLGADKPISNFEGVIIAIIHRKDDVEDKWVVAPKGTNFSDEEILKSVMFQEKYFDIKLHR